MALPTDQKVGGSSPFERATHIGLVGNPGEACCRMGPGASERSSCVYPSRTKTTATNVPTTPTATTTNSNDAENRDGDRMWWFMH